MRIRFSKTYPLALLAVAACATAPAASAVTAAGGVASAPAPTIHKVALATWFGPGFYGQTTACGQTLTPSVVGVANRTLPCGTLVRFGYKGHAVTVPVIDRGPYAHNGAQWDLTLEAAHALGMADTARIHTRIVGSVPNTRTLGLPPGAPAVTATGGAAATT
ncbi:MAG TPA: septal ring lytic transglycosylase RlpA family protein [Solirubrobacteraceae bacterium]|jgi:rare lipoprotein A|nr:septal ring lytic transglycosylase RlpA family protein [Solirubrobacteraceae bacterium]